MSTEAAGVPLTVLDTLIHITERPASVAAAIMI